MVEKSETKTIWECDNCGHMEVFKDSEENIGERKGKWALLNGQFKASGSPVFRWRYKLDHLCPGCVSAIDEALKERLNDPTRNFSIS